MKSWNEIRKSATAFSKRWKSAYNENLFPPSRGHPHFDYIFGNPPFLGRTMKMPKQQAEISSFFDCKDIDFVACWYAKAAKR